MLVVFILNASFRNNQAVVHALKMKKEADTNGVINRLQDYNLHNSHEQDTVLSQENTCKARRKCFIYNVLIAC